MINQCIRMDKKNKNNKTKERKKNNNNYNNKIKQNGDEIDLIKI